MGGERGRKIRDGKKWEQRMDEEEERKKTEEEVERIID